MQLGEECPQGDVERKDIHPWIAGLLGDIEHNTNNVKVGRMAEKATACLHLELMEGSKSKNTKSHETAKILRSQVGLF